MAERALWSKPTCMERWVAWPSPRASSLGACPADAHPSDRLLARVGIIRRIFWSTLLMSFAFVFPGQGSQSVGMLAALAGANPVVRVTFDEASAVLGYDLWQLVQEGPEERLNATERTQPAMLAAGIATWRLWHSRGGRTPA